MNNRYLGERGATEAAAAGAHVDMEQDRVVGLRNQQQVGVSD